MTRYCAVMYHPDDTSSDRRDPFDAHILPCCALLGMQTGHIGRVDRTPIVQVGLARGQFPSSVPAEDFRHLASEPGPMPGTESEPYFKSQ